MRTLIEHAHSTTFFRDGYRCNSCTTAAVIASPKVVENMMAINMGRDEAKEKGGENNGNSR